MNSMGIPGALGSQLFFGSCADWMKERGYSGRAQWDPGLYVCAAALVVGAVAWLFIDPTRSAVGPPDKKAGEVNGELTKA
ncbi:MAG TPA: hypothetical protein VJ739_12310, partial [Gemmataceae bacterium]|nr:hypothetical protein [Gemmataceae bacterium]